MSEAERIKLEQEEARLLEKFKAETRSGNNNRLVIGALAAALHKVRTKLGK